MANRWRATRARFSELKYLSLSQILSTQVFASGFDRTKRAILLAGTEFAFPVGRFHLVIWREGNESASAEPADLRECRFRLVV
jgi:hypothetical protein